MFSLIRRLDNLQKKAVHRIGYSYLAPENRKDIETFLEMYKIEVQAKEKSSPNNAFSMHFEQKIRKELK